jgi:Protein of unknown function (DUF2568)
VISGLKGLLPVVLLVRFLTELGLLAALAAAGLSLDAPLPVRVLLAVAAPGAAAAAWGRFVAPRSARRLRDPARLVLEAVLFGAATLALVLAGHPAAATVLAAAAAVTAPLSRAAE